MEFSKPTTTFFSFDSNNKKETKREENGKDSYRVWKQVAAAAYVLRVDVNADGEVESRARLRGLVQGATSRGLRRHGCHHGQRHGLHPTRT